MKQPIAVHITDTHLSENTIDINRNVYTQLFKLCDQLGVKHIFHGGDIFTSRKGQTEAVLNAFKAILDEAFQTGMKIIAIAGNHDKTNYVSDSSFLDAFDGHPAFTVVGAGGSILHDEINIVFLPYYDEKLSYHGKLEEINTKLIGVVGKHILITHVGIDGVKANSGIKVANEIKPNLFAAFQLVLVGHYHDRQTLGENIIYTGSAYQANFGENDEKGVTVIYGDASCEFINLDFPKYITIDVLQKDLDADLVQMITNKSEEAKIRIRINDVLDDSKKGVAVELESLGVKVVVEKGSYVPVDGIGAAQVSFTNQDILVGYDEWAKDRGIEDPEFGKSMLTEVL